MLLEALTIYTGLLCMKEADVETAAAHFTEAVDSGDESASEEAIIAGTACIPDANVQARITHTRKFYKNDWGAYELVILTSPNGTIGYGLIETTVEDI